MADDDRVQDALAAYLDHLEMGGPEPDTSHLSASERRDLDELIDALALTEGVALGRDSSDGVRPQAVPGTPEGQHLVTQLRAALPPSARVEADANTLIAHVGGIGIVERWLVGTFGGRVRVWLLEVESAAPIEQNADCLADLNRVFRMFPDMSAVALVGKDLTCLLVEPQDCAPQIQVPSGSLTSRRFKRASAPAVDAITGFLDELIPYWDPAPAFDTDAGVRFEVEEIGADEVRAAMDEQRGIGDRARKGNPKKDALLAFGMKEATVLSKLVAGLYAGTIEPDEIAERIERLANGS